MSVLRGRSSLALIVVSCGLTLLSISPDLKAGLLISQRFDDHNYGYGLNSWGNFTVVINSAFGNQVSVVPDFEDLGKMLLFDALLLELRESPGELSATEASSIAAFASTGRRVLIMGENDQFSTWNNQVLAIVGGTYMGHHLGIVTRLVENELTDGAPSLRLVFGGVANTSGVGTALYAPNFATLWGDEQNVLTVLDVNVWDDSFWNSNSGGVFGTNVATWLASGLKVPEPTTTALALAATLFFIGRRRIR